MDTLASIKAWPWARGLELSKEGMCFNVRLVTGSDTLAPSTRTRQATALDAWPDRAREPGENVRPMTRRPVCHHVNIQAAGQHKFRTAVAGHSRQ